MRLAGAAAALVILFNACGSFCLAENHDDMHGVNHPLVSIHLDGDPLKLQLSDDGQTELTFSFSVRGLLPGFTYNTVVHECDENGVPGRQSNHTVVSMDRDASSNEGMRDRQVTKCKMGLRVLDGEQIRYRLFIMVWDAYEVLPSREALVAQRDVTVSLVQDTGGRAGTASDKPKGAKQLGTTVPDSQDPGVTTANLSAAAVASRTSDSIEAETAAARNASVASPSPHHRLHGVSHPSVSTHLMMLIPTWSAAAFGVGYP